MPARWSNWGRRIYEWEYGLPRGWTDVWLTHTFLDHQRQERRKQLRWNLLALSLGALALLIATICALLNQSVSPL